jgi:fumarate reductase flavoprotein subunit
LTDGSIIRAGKVILAVNGFAGNRDLVGRFCPEIAGASYFGALGSTGEAAIWGEEIGAGLSNMSAYQGYAAVAHPHGSLLSWTTIEKGGFILNDKGERFGDESIGYSGFARIVLSQGDFCYAVFDQRIFDIASQEEEFLELARYGGLKTGDTVSDVAKAFDVDATAATRTLEAYNRMASGEVSDPFGRRDYGLAPLMPPFYGCRVVSGLFHTQGGLKVGTNAEVLRADGTPVPNLFAGGGAAAGISGKAGATGYASGNGLLTAIALGRLAGLEAARQVRNAKPGSVR